MSPDRVLTISGERSTENRSGSEEEGTLHVERSFGTFTRRLRLPDGVDVEGESRRAELRGQQRGGRLCMLPAGSVDSVQLLHRLPGSWGQHLTPVSLWQYSAHQTFAVPTLPLAGIKATAKDGVLSISVPKVPQPQPVHIPVQAGGEHADGQPAEQAEQEPAAPAEEAAQQE